MKMRALDSFATAGIGMIHAGQEFEIDSDVRGQELEARGLAKAIGAAPHNKMELAPLNKSEPATKPRKTRGRKKG